MIGTRMRKKTDLLTRHHWTSAGIENLLNYGYQFSLSSPSLETRTIYGWWSLIPRLSPHPKEKQKRWGESLGTRLWSVWTKKYLFEALLCWGVIFVHNSISFFASFFETHFASHWSCVLHPCWECNYSAYCETAKECILLEISKHLAYLISGTGRDRTIPENAHTEIVVPQV